MLDERSPADACVSAPRASRSRIASGARARVDGAQRFEAARASRNHEVRALDRGEARQHVGGQERHVARDDERALARRSSDRRVDAAERPRAGDLVGHDAQARARSRRRIGSATTNTIGATGAQHVQLTIDDCGAADRQRTLVDAAEPPRTAAGEDRRRQRRAIRRLQIDQEYQIRGAAPTGAMSEARIGRVLVASLHQAIADILPTRLEFYENWLNVSGLREGTIGLAPLSAVLSFLRTEGEAYDLITARAGRVRGGLDGQQASPARAARHPRAADGRCARAPRCAPRARSCARRIRDRVRS